jgi:hypothetical protein
MPVCHNPADIDRGVCCLIVLAAARPELGRCRRQSCEVSTMEHRPKTRLDQVRDAIRLTHDSMRTEESSVAWITRYILFHNQRHPTRWPAKQSRPF